MRRLSAVLVVLLVGLNAHAQFGRGRSFSPPAYRPPPAFRPSTPPVRPPITPPVRLPVTPSPTIIRPNTTIVRPNATIVRPSTTIVRPNTTIVRPNTAIVRPGGLTPRAPTPAPSGWGRASRPTRIVSPAVRSRPALTTPTARTSVMRNPAPTRGPSVVFRGSQVHQRNHLIDPKKVDSRGRTNLQRMRQGLAPLGPDNRSINLHHVRQKPGSPVVEVTRSFHSRHHGRLHTQFRGTPSRIDRRQFGQWRRDYWKNRALDFN